VFEWHKQFSEGRESLKDDDQPGRPHTAVTDDGIEKVQGVIPKDQRLGVRAVAEEVYLDRESTQRILREELNMIKVCAKMVPKVLSDEQKECHKELCLDLLQCIENELDLLNLIITFDGTWIFTYDPETKRQSMQWKSTLSPRPKKARMSRSKFKAMLIVFFDIQGIVMAEWVPSSQMVNQQYYIEVLMKLHERVRRKRLELWRCGWILHQDSASANNALSVKQFLANKNITVLEHALQNMTCRIALNIGSIICSCVLTQKGTILKVIVVDFLNLVNRKSYRHSLVFFVCVRLCICIDVKCCYLIHALVCSYYTNHILWSEFFLFVLL